ncbi:MAG: NUDIX domain-containing protein [Succinatimonas hippei]|nr:NUDIX domain-containing protein [Succinatimonas hippei]
MNIGELARLQSRVPVVLGRRKNKVSNFFTVEQLDLRFSNGEERTYERLVGGNGAVEIVPWDGANFLMTAEYACGFERYELGFVKGKIETGETPEQACQRELEEEIGYGFTECMKLKDVMKVAPGMLSLRMHTFLCTGIYEKKLDTGDEPEPIDIVKVTPEEAKKLIFDPSSPLTESRAIACLTLAMHKLGMIG